MDSPLYSEKDFTRAAAWVLRRLRKKRGISQERAAELVGLSRQYLTRFEGGHHTPSSYLLAQFADAYSVPLTELMEQIEQRAIHYASKRRSR